MKIELNNIYNLDCLVGFSFIEDKSIDLIIIDPPYNIGKDTWDKIKDYNQWMLLIFKECERVLKTTGSFYWFHNDFDKVTELHKLIKDETNFILRNFITWNKKFKGCEHEEYLNAAILTNKNRTYRKFSEYILFYTFDDITDLDYSHISLEVYKPIREYFSYVMNKSNLSWKSDIVVNTFLKNGYGKDYFNARQISQNKLNPNYSQFRLFSKQEYNFLAEIISFDKSYDELKSWWDILNLEYRKKRGEYKKANKNKLSKIRYTFNKQPNHSVFQYQTPQDKLHICEKPLEMIEDIIKTSSNVDDVVLDCFMGSGTTAKACVKTKRNYIGFEKESKYFKIIDEKIKN